MLRRLLPFALILTAAAADEFVPALPSEARLFLRVPPEGKPLPDLRVSLGDASPGTHEDTPEKRERLTDIRFPVRWWSWRELTITFTPAHDGTIELDLNGPWGEARPGVLLQQEVLWDNFTATGTTIPNAGFESLAEGNPESWHSPWRPYPAADTWPLAGSQPLEGKACAASWHGRPLICKLPVKSGVPVTLKLHARAATAPGFKPPARLPQDTPAHRACASLKRGVNLGNGWEAPPGSWGITYDVQDIDRIADEGFDHIRVPVAWHYHLENGAIKPALLASLEPVLKRALERKLTVILNWHHFEDLCNEPDKHRAAFAAGWETVARHFKDWPPQLFLELLNEPNAALDSEILAAVHAEGIAAIRKSNPARILLANPPQWASIPGLDRFFLPDGDPRIIASIHSYEPFQFTHQRASWVDLQDLRGISYPGPPPQPVALPESLRDNTGLAAWLNAYNTRKGSDNPCTAAAFELLLDDAAAWSAHFGRPIHIGEFGCFKEADPASRERYIRDFRTAAERRRIPWAMWDWKAGFGYWDADHSKPLLRNALFK
jgi:endoglucanase